MKKTILILVAIILTVSGCVHEEKHLGCPVDMSLIFAYDGSVEDFDKIIGNDVELYLFRNDIFISKEIIPHSEIEKGKPYIIKDNLPGRIDIVALAVPLIEGEEQLKEGLTHNGSYKASYYQMPGITRAPIVDPVRTTLGLGRYNTNWANNTQEEKKHIVSLNNAFCNLTVIIEDAEQYVHTYPGTPSINVEGISDRMSIATLESIGDELEVKSFFVKETALNQLTSAKMGILPTLSGRTLKINVLNDDQKEFFVETTEKAISGKEIMVIINIGNSEATIIVDNWKIKTQIQYL